MLLREVCGLAQLVEMDPIEERLPLLAIDLQITEPLGSHPRSLSITSIQRSQDTANAGSRA
jgi:hypothetical protein